jgi:hypothetical protein
LVLCAVHAAERLRARRHDSLLKLPVAGGQRLYCVALGFEAQAERPWRWVETR